MKLWLLAQTENTGWDTYDSAVVAAETEDAARMTHPYGNYVWREKERLWRSKGGHHWTLNVWATPESVTVKYIGEAAPGTNASVICASFNAG